MQLKMDELIFSVKAANNAKMNIETLTDEQLDRLAVRYRSVAALHQRPEHARETRRPAR